MGPPSFKWTHSTCKTVDGITACSQSRPQLILHYTHVSTWRVQTLPCAAERLPRCPRCPCPVKMAFTLWAQICRLPSSDTPQRGSDICLRVALSSSPVTGSLDSHWKLLQKEMRDEMCHLGWVSLEGFLSEMLQQHMLNTGKGWICNTNHEGILKVWWKAWHDALAEITFLPFKREEQNDGRGCL